MNLCAHRTLGAIDAQELDTASHQNTKKNFQKRMDDVFAPWVCAHLSKTASGVTQSTPAAAIATPRARSESWTMFYVQERRAAARCRSAAGRPRARAGALASARLTLCGKPKGLHVRFRAFSMRP